MDIKTKELSDIPDMLRDLWGERQLIALTMGSNGHRYWEKFLKEKGVTRIASRKDPGRGIAVAMIVAVEPGWQIVWTEGHDLDTLSINIADDRGIHVQSFDTSHSHEGMRTIPWPGQEPLSEAELTELFKTLQLDQR